MLLQFLVNGIILGSVYALISLGFALVYNTTRIFHVAYCAIYMLSPYFILSFYTNTGMPFFLSFILSISLTLIVSLLIEVFVYKPLTKANSSLNIILISSIGVMIVIVNSVAMFYGNETQILNSSISSTFQWGSVIITYTQAIQFVVCLILLSGFMIFIKYSGFGIKLRAMRDDDILFSILGGSPFKMRLLLFSLSAVFASIGGGLIAYDVGMDPYIGMPMLLNAVVALIIGGMGRFEAPIIGGFLLGVLQALSVWAISARWQDAITFSILILFLLFRPEGIIGERRRMV